MKTEIKEYHLLPTLEKLCGRKLQTSDGISKTDILKAESKLDIYLPPLLKEFYGLAGNMELFTSSFNEFATPEQLF